MDHPLLDLINQRIGDAETAGDFDNLPGAGKPLPPEDDPENALINRLIRDTGAVPEFVSLGRELRRLREALSATGERTRRLDIAREMSTLEARIEIAKQAWRR